MLSSIPTVPDGSWPVYSAVERFLLDHHGYVEVGGQTFKAIPSYEELGQLTRLAQDLRSDAGHLETLAEDVEELIGQCVDAIRNAEAAS